jgi:hypothetical protein
MSLQIGRIGLATASGGDGYTLDDPRTISQNGNTVQLEGAVTGTTTALLWLRDQILGLVGPSAEKVVPVRFSTTSPLDGFYRVVDASFEDPPGGLGASGSTNWAFWQVALERVTDWLSPRVDAFSVYGLIDNGVSITATTSYLFAPPDITQWSRSRTALRTTSDGASEVSVDTASSSAGGAVLYPTYTVPIASYYKGGARVYYDPADDGTQRLVIGRKGFTSRLDDLQITNGLVRVTFSADAVSASWYSGDNGVAGTWESAVTFYVTAGALGNVTADTATVIHNTPESVTVRYQGHTAVGLGTGYFQTIDISIRRGSRTVSCYAQASATAQWRFGINSGPAMTAVGTPTIRYTSNDADGNRLFLTSTQGSGDTTNKRVGNPTARADFNFGFGFELGGSGSSGSAAITDQIQDYFNPVTTTERVATL